MRKFAIACAATAAMFMIIGSAQAEKAWRKDAQGRWVQVELTGKYDDCVKGGEKMRLQPGRGDPLLQ